MQGLGLMPDSEFATCNAISSDGSTIVGRMVGTDSSSQAYRWRQGSFQGLGVLGGDDSGEAFGVSADGSVVVGVSTGLQSQAFRWTESEQMQPLGFLPGGSFSSARGVSDDGGVVVGFGDSSNATMGAGEAFRWTASDGMLHSLGDLSGGRFHSRAFAVSGDGLVAVGDSDSDQFDNPVRYAGAIESLGDLNAVALAASADGSVIVGAADFGGGLAEAFVWDAAHGLRRLADILSGDPALSGWTLGPAQGASADGQSIVGWGSVGGNSEAWLALLPEPDNALLQGAAIAALAGLSARSAAGRAKLEG
jgi:probable HAF family extracellular repeat protein